MKTTEVELLFSQKLGRHSSTVSVPSVNDAWSAFKSLLSEAFECQRLSAFFEAGASSFSAPYFQFVLVFKHVTAEEEWNEQFHVEFSESQEWKPSNTGLFSADFPNLPAFIHAVESSPTFVEGRQAHFLRFTAYHTPV